MIRSVFFIISLAWNFAILAQEAIISGRVTDLKGNPIERVSVILSGTKKGTLTNKEGNYNISATPGKSLLIFSSAGYRAEQRSVGNTLTVDVQMDVDENKLSEVIVTATGIEKSRRYLGYSVGTLRNEELTMSKTSNLVTAIGGKVAGVRVNNVNGVAGSGASIFIRGFNTIASSNQPLFVVDGIPIDNSGGGNSSISGVTLANRAIDIGQYDIESITVLKGPAAAVLYGSRAASGAIIIKTRSGKQKQKNAVRFSSSFQISNVNRIPDYQNEYGQGQSVNDNPGPSEYARFNPNSNSSWGPLIEGQTIKNFEGQDEKMQAYPDNAKEILRHGLNFQNNIGLSGGGERTNYGLSLGNLYEKGVTDNNDYLRNNISFNGGAELTNKLTSDLHVQYINSRSKRIQQGLQASNPFFTNWHIPRSISLKNYPYEQADKSQNYFLANVDNPQWTIKKNLWNDEVNRVIGNIFFKYNVAPWLNITYRFGGDFYSQSVNAFDEIGARGQANTQAGGTGGILELTNQFKSYYSYVNLNFRTRISKDVDFSAILGNEISSMSNRINSSVGRSLAIRGFRNLSNASIYTATNFESSQSLTGIYADLNFMYKGVATLNLTGRNDWSSTFGDAQKSYFYPSIAGSVNLKEAIPWIRKQDFINFAKVFSNFATVGKTAEPYSTQTFFLPAEIVDNSGSAINFPLNGVPGYTLSNTMGDPSLGPEFTSSLEIGTELGFWNNRILLEAAWYSTNSRDIIFGVLFPPSTGIAFYTTNSGKLETRGWEFELSVTPIRNQEFTWTSSFNFTKYRTVCKELAEGVITYPMGGSFNTNLSARMQKGEPFGVFYGSLFRRNNGKLWLNEKGLAVLDNTFKRIGDPNPDWLMGIFNTLKYRNFQLNFLVDIRAGGDVYARNLGELRRYGVAEETAEYPRFADDKSTPNKPYIIDGVGPDGTTPNNVPLTAEQYYGNIYAGGVGESYVFDATWVRLREVNFGYRFPQSMFEKSFLGGLEVGLTGRNLLLYTPNYSHFDPENNTYGVSNIQGVEFNGLPSTRNIGVYVNLNF